MKKIIYIVVCVLAFAGGLGGTYYGKTQINKQKELDIAYEQFELKTIDTSKYNEEEKKEYQALEEKVKAAYKNKNITELTENIEALKVLDEKVKKRIETEQNDKFNQMHAEFLTITLPEGANDWETNHFNEIHAEVAKLFETKDSIDIIQPKLDELKTRRDNIVKWIAERPVEDNTPSNPDPVTYTDDDDDVNPPVEDSPAEDPPADDPPAED